MMSNPLRSIIWSVDVFGENLGAWQKSQVELLRLLAEKRKVSIEPVYVLSPDGLNISIRSHRDWAKKYVGAAESSLKAITRELRIPGLQPPTVLVQSSTSGSSSVKTLAAYAKRVKADSIFMGTHARSGLSRLVLGSFAENLLLQSRVPLLITHPHSQVRPIRRILFATDLQRVAVSVFRRVVALARELDAEIAILHVLANPVEPVLQSGVYLLGGGWVSFESYREKELAEKEKEAREWASEAEKSGVKCQTFLIPPIGKISETILSEAREKDCQLIAMAGQSGRVAAALVGSVARQVVRGADLPVWIVRR